MLLASCARCAWSPSRYDVSSACRSCLSASLGATLSGSASESSLVKKISYGGGGAVSDAGMTCASSCVVLVARVGDLELSRERCSWCTGSGGEDLYFRRSDCGGSDLGGCGVAAAPRSCAGPLLVGGCGGFGLGTHLPRRCAQSQTVSVAGSHMTGPLSVVAGELGRSVDCFHSWSLIQG